MSGTPAAGVTSEIDKVGAASSAWLSDDSCFADLLLAALKTSRGKSATAIPIVPMSPKRAEVTADTGSQGSSSVLYSLERNLWPS